MARSALARKFVATTIAAIACGGVAWASASMVPAGGGHRSASEVSDTTAVSDSTTAPDATTTTFGDTTTTTDETTSTTIEPVTTTTLAGTPSTEPCNHGANVSKVAHAAPRGSDAEPGAH